MLSASPTQPNPETLVAANSTQDARPSFTLDIRAGDLHIDRRYQPIDRYNEVRARRIAEEWDWLRYQPLQVGIYDDGLAYIIDGQHRWNAAKMRFGVDCMLPCYVVGGVSLEQAALVFANADKNRAALNIRHKFGALLAANDPSARAIEQILLTHGWGISTTNSPSSNRIACIATVRRIFNDAKGGPARLDQTIRLVTEIWGHTPKTASALVIGGMGRFLKMHGNDPKLKEPRLVAALQPIPVERIIGPDAGAIAVKLGMRAGDINHLPIALAIRDHYNRGLRSSARIGSAQ